MAQTDLYGLYNALQASNRGSDLPSDEAFHEGFRLASVPKPSAAVLMLMGGAALLAGRGRGRD